MPKHDEPTPNLTPDERKWVKLTRFMRFEVEGDTISGYYLGYFRPQIRKPDGTNEPARVGQYALLTPDGPVRFNETSQLEQLQSFPIGTEIRVVYTGQVTTLSGYRAKTFDLYTPEDVAAGLFGELLENARTHALPGAVSPVAETTPADDPDDSGDPFRDQ